MEIATRVFILTVGGACGVNARYWLSLLIARWFGARFPWATVAINISGSFAIGLGAVVLAARWPHPHVRIFALTGFLGGYTTFSAYMFESVNLWEQGDRSRALANLLGSVALGLVAVVFGMALGRWATEPSPRLPLRTTQADDRVAEVREAIAGQESRDEAAPSAPGGGAAGGQCPQK